MIGPAPRPTPTVGTRDGADGRQVERQVGVAGLVLQQPAAAEHEGVDPAAGDVGEQASPPGDDRRRAQGVEVAPQPGVHQLVPGVGGADPGSNGHAHPVMGSTTGSSDLAASPYPSGARRR